MPPSEPISPASRLASLLGTIVKAILGTALGVAFVAAFVVVTLTGVGPLWELWQRRRDREVLDPDALLRDHPDLSLLEIPPGVNGASGGKPYRIMVRVTRPKEKGGDGDDAPDLPPVIFPGGLASNLTTMARHQDELTSRHGFVVVNFDRLGVGLSDPHPDGRASRPPSAADVAREMDYVMRHVEGIDDAVRWIQVGGSMGTNVATAFAALFPNRLCGFLNLDGLPHAFLQIQCKKFLRDRAALMGVLRRWTGLLRLCKKFLRDRAALMGVLRALRWTGLPRLAFTAALRPVFPIMGDAFTPRQVIGVMCREQSFIATGLEYTTLMSCCDLECAAWGAQATTECDDESLRILASMAPEASVIINEGKGVPRSVTEERSKSELGVRYLTREDKELNEFERKFQTLALKTPDEVERTRTHCNWPQPPKHPVGDFVGGVDKDTTIYPLAPQFASMVVRIMCARDYAGLERDYTQEARNHAAGRCALQVIASGDGGKAYYYPRLSHLNLWQQVSEVVNITHEMSEVIVRQQIR
ncbi:hypothetical protein ACHAWF_014377 [Thalassiosira exigua]